MADWVVQGEGSRLSGELYWGQKMHLQRTGLIVSRGQGRGWEINAQHHLNGAAGAFAWMRQSIHFRRGLLPSRSWRLLQAAWMRQPRNKCTLSTKGPAEEGLPWQVEQRTGGWAGLLSGKELVSHAFQCCSTSFSAKTCILTQYEQIAIGFYLAPNLIGLFWWYQHAVH